MQVSAQGLPVRFIKKDSSVVEVLIGNKLFTKFMYQPALKKPILFPLTSATGRVVTRGFPLTPLPGEPKDHPHHTGLWLNYENVNGIDFWNNSYAITPSEKARYGSIVVSRVTGLKEGDKGSFDYYANWNNSTGQTILEEHTRYLFSGDLSSRYIDRITKLTARVKASFIDAKDGLLGIRLAHEFQIPSNVDKKFTDDKGNTTVVKGGTDRVANGSYVSSSGKKGDSVWSTRGTWCKAYTKIGTDSVSICVFDHEKNINYPIYWHARGYGLFAANPIGVRAFSKGSAYSLNLQPGESTIFRYRIVIHSGKNTPPSTLLDSLQKVFSNETLGIE